MSIWGTFDIDTQPELTIVRWRVIETDLNERHLVGYVLENSEGRVSSALEEIDSKKRIVTTRSGRVYELSGPPGFDADGQHVWQRWKRINDVKSEQDVTQEVWAQLSSGTDEPQVRAVG